MIHRIITEDELKDIKVEGMTDADRLLIEECLVQFAEKDNKIAAMRGFLVQLCEEEIIDDDLRKELPIDAASFSEGWDCAYKFGKADGE